MRLVDDIADGFDRFVGQRFTLVTGEVDLDVGGLGVVALGSRSGQRVAPQVLNVFNVFGVGVKLFDDLVVVGVSIAAQGILAL